MTGMRRIMRRTAELMIVGGSLIGVGSCLADVATCPGEIQDGDTGGDVDAPVLLCDEHPESDDLFNSPGTTEQKVMYGSLVVVALGAGTITLLNRSETAQ